MGVHDGDYLAVKQALGIPPDEPIFVIRAQDNLSIEAIRHYEIAASFMGCDLAFLRGLFEVRLEFAKWQETNRSKMKVPD